MDKEEYAKKLKRGMAALVQGQTARVGLERIGRREARNRKGDEYHRLKRNQP